MSICCNFTYFYLKIRSTEPVKMLGKRFTHKKVGVPDEMHVVNYCMHVDRYPFSFASF